jgi:predicted O-methyltransferase YrrM
MDLYFAFAAAYVSESVLGKSGTPATVERLLELKCDIDRKLQRTFSLEDRARYATGGGPGLKEILLYVLIRRTGPDNVVETGVAQGVSTAFILRALEDNHAGSLVSIDLPNFSSEGYRYRFDPDFLDQTYVKPDLGVGWLAPASLRHRWTLKLGSSEDELPRLGNLKIDLFLHDSEHSYENMMQEYHWALNHLRPGGILASDDVSFNTAFVDLLHEFRASLHEIARAPIGICQSLPSFRA